MEGYWVMAFEYPSQDSAYTAWNRAQEEIRGLIGTGHTSAYRCLVQGRMSVIIIGENPFSDQLQEIFLDICVEGEETTVPTEVVAELMKRRQNFRRSGYGFRTRHFRVP